HAHYANWPALPIAGVLRHAPVPVIAVPSTAQHQTAAFAHVRSVLVPTDLAEPAHAALATAYGLLHPSGGTVELCTIHDRGPLVPAAEARLAPPLDDQERAKVEEQLRAMLPP